MKNHHIDRHGGIALLLASSWLGAACGSGGGSSDAMADPAPAAARNSDGASDPDNPNAGATNGANGAAAEGGGEENPGGISPGSGAPGSTDDGSGKGSDDDRSRGGGSGGSRNLTREALEGAEPLRSLVDAANDPRLFTQPRAGVALSNGALAFIGLDARTSAQDRLQSGARSAVFLQRRDGLQPAIQFNGNGLVTPLDIDVSLDDRTLFVADFAGGSRGLGAIVQVPVNGGAIGFAAEGYLPRAVTVAPSGQVFFSGVDPKTGSPGVFELAGSSVTPVFTGAPLLDPSGIAAFSDGRLLVADTGAFDAGNGPVLTSRGSVILIERGQASVFAGGFAVGFPAGIALTLDESTLLVSGEGADRSDTLFLLDVEDAAAPPKAITASFSAFKDAAAGLKRAHDENTFVWASLAANGGGTVFRIED